MGDAEALCMEVLCRAHCVVSINGHERHHRLIILPGGWTSSFWCGTPGSSRAGELRSCDVQLRRGAEARSPLPLIMYRPCDLVRALVRNRSLTSAAKAPREILHPRRVGMGPDARTRACRPPPPAAPRDRPRSPPPPAPPAASPSSWRHSFPPSRTRDGIPEGADGRPLSRLPGWADGGIIAGNSC